ncbi:Hypothetical predicted protein [Xyrichtys novacula]|uniref:Uncharacterized protein n=1 Tax=Xyrichtys novacula TaxID=13765 RepID=A0AAV1H2C0_XYRNO|nr:Hypothetical predicted protein [Xyrichtys novacula]
MEQLSHELSPYNVRERERDAVADLTETLHDFDLESQGENNTERGRGEDLESNQSLNSTSKECESTTTEGYEANLEQKSIAKKTESLPSPQAAVNPHNKISAWDSGIVTNPNFKDCNIENFNITITSGKESIVPSKKESVNAAAPLHKSLLAVESGCSINESLPLYWTLNTSTSTDLNMEQQSHEPSPSNVRKKQRDAVADLTETRHDFDLESQGENNTERGRGEDLESNQVLCMVKKQKHDQPKPYEECESITMEVDEADLEQKNAAEKTESLPSPQAPVYRTAKISARDRGIVNNPNIIGSNIGTLNFTLITSGRESIVPSKEESVDAAAPFVKSEYFFMCITKFQNV